MSNYKTIEEYNEYLIKESNKQSLKDYINEYHLITNKNLDISFMEYFMEIIEHKKEFYVPHNKLKEYKIISNTKSSVDIKRCLDQFNLIEDEDYRVRNVAHPVPQGGFSNKKEYRLTPYAFKICLMRAKNTKIYAYYYLFLEECIYYYNKFQSGYDEYIIANITNKNKTLNQKIDEQTKKIDELLNYGKETHIKLDEVLDQNDELNDKVDELNEDVDDLNDKVDDLREDKHEKCNNDNDNHFFSLLKTYNLNEYKIVCGLGKHNDKLIAKKEDNGVKINKNYTPNACTLRKRFKENDKIELQLKLDEIKNNKKLKNKVNLKREVRKNKKFIIKGSKIILNTGTEEELINKFIELNNERYDEFKNCIV